MTATKLNKKIRELIKIKNTTTRSDLQGIVDFIAIEIAPGKWKLQSDIANEILIIVDHSAHLAEFQLEYHIANLEENIKKWKNEWW